jgi:hypothetical protein
MIKKWRIGDAIALQYHQKSDVRFIFYLENVKSRGYPHLNGEEDSFPCELEA